MERIVGIDYGKKRTGIAVSDPLEIFASALETVPSADIVSYLKNYTQKESVKLFVVGYPVNLNNKPAEGARFVDVLLNLLKKHFPLIPVILEDERFTSKMAFQTMIDGGVRKMERRDKSMVDKISAAIILQSYLDRIAIQRSRTN
jgi:putative holliday junction resolvase